MGIFSDSIESFFDAKQKRQNYDIQQMQVQRQQAADVNAQKARLFDEQMRQAENQRQEQELALAQDQFSYNQFKDVAKDVVSQEELQQKSDLETQQQIFTLSKTDPVAATKMWNAHPRIAQQNGTVEFVGDAGTDSIFERTLPDGTHETVLINKKSGTMRPVVDAEGKSVSKYFVPKSKLSSSQEWKEPQFIAALGRTRITGKDVNDKPLSEEGKFQEAASKLEQRLQVYESANRTPEQNDIEEVKKLMDSIKVGFRFWSGREGHGQKDVEKLEKLNRIYMGMIKQAQRAATEQEPSIQTKQSIPQTTNTPKLADPLGIR